MKAKPSHIAAFTFTILGVLFSTFFMAGDVDWLLPALISFVLALFFIG